jgi:hypothetical protein
VPSPPPPAPSRPRRTFEVGHLEIRTKSKRAREKVLRLFEEYPGETKVKPSAPSEENVAVVEYSAPPSAQTREFDRRLRALIRELPREAYDFKVSWETSERTE